MSKPLKQVSQFDVKLDDILVAFYNGASNDVYSDNNHDGTVYTKAGTQAKQALTSLIKELVAEAKPEEHKNYYTTDPVEGGRRMGYNEAVREFEQNLLKALEDKK